MRWSSPDLSNEAQYICGRDSLLLVAQEVDCEPLIFVYVAGVLELAGAAGLVLPLFARAATIYLIKCGTEGSHATWPTDDAAVAAGAHASVVHRAALVVDLESGWLFLCF
jgi:hypothetical protein